MSELSGSFPVCGENDDPSSFSTPCNLNSLSLPLPQPTNEFEERVSPEEEVSESFDDDNDDEFSNPVGRLPISSPFQGKSTTVKNKSFFSVIPSNSSPCGNDSGSLDSSSITETLSNLTSQLDQARLAGRQQALQLEVLMDQVRELSNECGSLQSNLVQKERLIDDLRFELQRTKNAKETVDTPAEARSFFDRLKAFQTRISVSAALSTPSVTPGGSMRGSIMRGGDGTRGSLIGGIGAVATVSEVEREHKSCDGGNAFPNSNGSGSGSGSGVQGHTGASGSANTSLPVLTTSSSSAALSRVASSTSSHTSATHTHTADPTTTSTTTSATTNGVSIVSTFSSLSESSPITDTSASSPVDVTTLNGRISALESLVKRLESEKHTLTTSIDAKNDEINTLQGKVMGYEAKLMLRTEETTLLSSRVSQLQESVRQLEAELEEVKEERDDERDLLKHERGEREEYERQWLERETGWLSKEKEYQQRISELLKTRTEVEVSYSESQAALQQTEAALQQNQAALQESEAALSTAQSRVSTLEAQVREYAQLLSNTTHHASNTTSTSVSASTPTSTSDADADPDAASDAVATATASAVTPTSALSSTSIEDLPQESGDASHDSGDCIPPPPPRSSLACPPEYILKHQETLRGVNESSNEGSGGEDAKEDGHIHEKGVCGVSSVDEDEKTDEQQDKRDTEVSGEEFSGDTPKDPNPEIPSENPSENLADGTFPSVPRRPPRPSIVVESDPNHAAAINAAAATGAGAAGVGAGAGAGATGAGAGVGVGVGVGTGAGAPSVRASISLASAARLPQKEEICLVHKGVLSKLGIDSQRHPYAKKHFFALFTTNLDYSAFYPDVTAAAELRWGRTECEFKQYSHGTTVKQGYCRAEAVSFLKNHSENGKTLAEMLRPEDISRLFVLVTVDNRFVVLMSKDADAVCDTATTTTTTSTTTAKSLHWMAAVQAALEMNTRMVGGEDVAVVKAACMDGGRDDHAATTSTTSTTTTTTTATTTTTGGAGVGSVGSVGGVGISTAIQGTRSSISANDNTSTSAYNYNNARGSVVGLATPIGSLPINANNTSIFSSHTTSNTHTSAGTGAGTGAETENRAFSSSISQQRASLCVNFGTAKTAITTQSTGGVHAFPSSFSSLVTAPPNASSTAIAGLNPMVELFPASPAAFMTTARTGSVAGGNTRDVALSGSTQSFTEPLKGPLIKFTHNGKDCHKKQFCLSPSGLIQWGDSENKYKYQELVKSVLRGHDSNLKIDAKALKVVNPDLIFTVRTTGKQLYLVAPTESVLNQWVDALEVCVQHNINK